MDRFLISETIDADACVVNGYPHPDLNPTGWMEAITSNVAFQIQEHAADLDWAKDIVRIALERAMNPRPIRRPLSAIENGILDDLAN